MAPQAPPDDEYSRHNHNQRDTTTRNVSSIDQNESMCRNATNKINHVLENIFAKIGYVVACNPWKTIAIALLISGLCLLGIVELQQENRGEKNWVSQSADPVKQKEWIDDIFPITNRPAGLLLEKADGGNLLTKAGLLKLYDLDLMTRAIHNGVPEKQWKDICFSGGGDQCIPVSILELWSYDLGQLSKLTDDDIKNKVNTVKLLSPMTGQNITVAPLIGITTRDASGKIVAASTLKISYKLKKRDVFDDSKGRQVDKHADDWEEAFEETFDVDFPGFNVLFNSQFTQTKVSNDATTGDLKFLLIGYMLVIAYLAIMLGSFSRISHKFFLAVAGIGVVGISIGVAFGLGSAFQQRYNNVHQVFPFLLLGIGVDDIFVIVQNWKNVGGPKVDHRSIPDKVSLAMRRAGVSVLVTSATDICAFLVGSATILPALRSFSIWCAIGILSIFLLTITLFVALLTLDARRQERRRDACCCCIKVDDTWDPMQCANKEFLKGFLKNFYAPAILSVPGKIIVLLIASGLLAAGAYGLSELEQDFDYIWFLPKDSTARKYVESDREAFPSHGEAGNVYLGQIDYFNSKDQMDAIKTLLEKDDFISTGSINSWYHHYHSWLYRNRRSELVPNNCPPSSCQAPNEDWFYELLKEFLETKDGKHYQKRIIFTKNGKKKIRASQIGFNHIKLIGSRPQIDAMDSITEAVKTGLISDDGEPILPFAFSTRYIQWETNKVISKELVRNIILAGGCVLVATLFLLSNIWVSLLVVVCVTFSLIEIAAFMGFWGLTIDVITTIIMVIAIGLTVDYSVHIAHGFMATRVGNQNARVTTALSEVGPAVIHGGTSTFLAFVLLAASKSYVFATFFKVFFLVVMFGMFHGMVFLPVILSLIGPAPYANHNNNSVNTQVTTVGGKDGGVQQQPQPPPPTIQLQRANNSNEESFVVIVENGQKNIAFLPE